MRSKFEKNVAKLLKKEKVKFEYETLKIPYTTISKYTPDFIIGDTIIEAKGYFRPSDRRVLKNVKRCNPELDIRLWFMQDNYLTKAKSGKYSDWARLNGFPFHIGLEFPRHWFP